ncbi:MAG: hypothetical protein Q8Q91_02035 [Candidatus Daviesbacteria bacterium]|nr:hypothetical protein [Candidatus Daviesbacteria bacterium]
MNLMAENNKKGNALAAGVAGAIIGAAAAAAAVALADEKNRKKAEKILAGLQKEGNKILKEISRRAMELKDMVGKKVSQAQAEPKKLKAKSK